MPQQPVYNAVTLEGGDSWDAGRSMREQERWDEHAALMDAFVADGFIILGGPLDDAQKVLLIINAEGRQAIEARFADDPWIQMGVRRIAKVERWEILREAGSKEISMSKSPLIYFAVIRERGGHWDAGLPMRQQEQWDEHAAFMDALADSGFVVLGGPLGDGEKKFLHIIAAESEQEIAARLADDPWTPLKMLRTVSVERWEILLDGTKS